MIKEKWKYTQLFSYSLCFSTVSFASSINGSCKAIRIRFLNFITTKNKDKNKNKHYNLYYHFW